MSPLFARKLKLLGLMCAFTSGVGVLYELIDESNKLSHTYVW